jgi:DNA invertase Pin-like site-specific DNA recombinase
MTVYGYARVSTEGQTLAGQEAQLAEAGAAKVFSEKISGASAANRSALAKVLAALSEGDVLMVTRLDRLARSTRDLLNVLDTISKAGAGFKSLADTWADTTTPHGRLMLTVLGGLAEFERELIKARTGEGRRRAQGRGVHGQTFGARSRSTAQGIGATGGRGGIDRYRQDVRGKSHHHRPTSIGATPPDTRRILELPAGLDFE